MVNNKKSKVKKEKHLPIVRTREERSQEVKKIITTLSELQLSVIYKPIRELYNIMNEYSISYINYLRLCIIIEN